MGKQKISKDFVNVDTGEVVENKLNEILYITTIRPNGSRRIQQDYRYCPTMAEQHTAHLTDINYLMEKMQPDELQAYINQRTQYRQEIIGHDFSREPSFQDANNIVVNSKKAFEELPDEIRGHFKNHVEFLKFIDNPDNQEKMIDLGLLTRKEIEKVIIPDPSVGSVVGAEASASKDSK